MRETTTTTKSIMLYQVPVTIYAPSLTAVVDRLIRLGIILSDLDVCVCVDDVSVLVVSGTYCTLF